MAVPGMRPSLSCKANFPGRARDAAPRKCAGKVARGARKGRVAAIGLVEVGAPYPSAHRKPAAFKACLGKKEN